MRLRVVFVGRRRLEMAPQFAKHVAGKIESVKYEQDGITDLTVLIVQVNPAMSEHWVFNQIGSFGDQPTSVEIL